MSRQVLPGLRPTPLASYLAGLGLVRLLGRQADPALTAAWTPAGLAVTTTVDDLAGWLVDHYVPTPVLSPWNEGSGFGAKDVTPRQRLLDLAALPSPRLDPFRAALAIARQVGERYRSGQWRKDTAKERAVREFRNTCPEELLPWIDAAVVLGRGQAYFPPLLGTGGNDGRLDFSTTFHQRLLDVLDPAPKAHQRALALARDLLSGTQQERLVTEAVGQFDPAGAGGKNSSPFGDADSLVNPWAFVLLVEGALLFAASAVRRQLHGTRREAVPFTVDASPDGSAGGAEGETSRGELWAPLWDRPFTAAEVRQLFTEARASWRGRPAKRAVEFYAATRTLGVARGVAAFQRYGLHQRNGLAFIAVPLERVKVEDKPAVRLAAGLEDWVSWVRRGEAATAVGRAVRRFDAAHLDFARDGGALALARLLAAVTTLEQAVGRSGRARDAVSVRIPPPATEFLRVFESEQPECVELRVAVGLASCATRAGSGPGGPPARTLRELLLPVDPVRRWRDAPVVPGYGLRPLPEVLADVLVWRCRTAADEPRRPDEVAFRGAPSFRTGVAVPAADLHAFARGGLDPDLLELWLRACLALRWDRVRHTWPGGSHGSLSVPTLGVLQPLAAGLAPAGAEPGTPRLALNPDWAVRLAAGRVAAVHGEAVRRLRQAGWRAVPAVPDAALPGSAVAAALVPRVAGARRALATFAVPERSEELSTLA